MKAGDLVRTKAAVAQWHTGSSRDFYKEIGLVIEREGYRVWVRWSDDNSVMWMPKQNLEVISESR